jgi:hypothetical protein
MLSEQESRLTALRALLLTLGGVATGAGIHSAVTGDGSLPGGPSGSTRADSELRYYGVFYAAFGMCALRAGVRESLDREVVRALAGTLFAGGIARAHGWRTRGKPHPVQLALLSAELGVPPMMLALSAD